jgi:hypothetical protein
MTYGRVKYEEYGKMYGESRPVWGQAPQKKGALIIAWLVIRMRVVMQKNDSWADQAETKFPTHSTGFGRTRK